MFKKYIIRTAKTVALPLILFVFFFILRPQKFGSWSTINIMFQQTFIPTIIGYGLSWGFIVGIWDFTVGARILLSALVGASFSVQFGMAGLILGCLISSLTLSVLTGAINWIARIPSLVISFGLVMVYEILGQWYSGKTSLMTVDSQITFLGSEPYNIILSVGVFVIFYIIFNNTKFSFQAKAVGSNEMLSRDMGIKVPKVKFMTYVWGGLFLGLASLLQISYAGSIGPQVNLTSIAVVFRPMIGLMIGIALSHVCNLAIGVFIGTLSINTIFIGIIALGLPDTMQNIFLGIFLLVVMIVSNQQEKVKEYFKRKKMAAANQITA